MKKILIGALMLVMTCALCGCGTKITYSSIYEEYSAKLQEAGEQALKEYKEEAAGKSDIMTLAEIATNKVMTLAEIQTEGGTKMAELMKDNGDDYSEYEDAYTKLYTVYSDQAMNVYNEYMNQSMDAFPSMTESMKQTMLDSFASSLDSMTSMQSE